MSGEIVNRVAKSSLITFDLEEIYPEGKRMRLDLSQWLEQGFILREKEFRTALKTLIFRPTNRHMLPFTVQPKPCFLLGRIYW